MLKHLTLALSVAALLPACTIISDDSASDTNNSSNATSTAGTTTAGDTTNPTTSTTGASATTGQTTGQTSGQTAEATGSDDATTDVPTTDVPTTDGTSGNTTSQTTGMTSSTTGETTGETTGGGLYGKCGWDDANNYYACEVDGGVGSLEGDSPIACAPGLEEGTKCTEDGPVTGAGCCTPEGVLYFCDSNGMTVFKQECGV